MTIIRVRNTSEAMAWIARNYYGAPAEAMQMIGITGTKGKTTTACMLYQMLKEAGVKCGLIGTLGIRRSDGLKKPGSNTTPDALVLQKELREMADARMQLLCDGSILPGTEALPGGRNHLCHWNLY